MPQPTINVAKIMPLVEPYAPHASGPSVMQALRASAIEFCEVTRCWRHMITVTIPAQGEPYYGEAVVAPDYAAIHEFEMVTFDDDIPLTPVQFSDVEQADFSREGMPCNVTQTGPNRVSIIPFQEGTLDLSVFLKPRHGSEWQLDAQSIPQNVYDTVPEFLFTLHGEIIAAGALSRILMLPGQPFSDARAAQYFRSVFDTRSENVYNHNVRGQHRAQPRIHPQFF